MDYWFIVYLASIFDNLALLLSVVGIGGIVISVAYGISSWIIYSEGELKELDYKKQKKFANTLFVVCCVFLLVRVFVPDTRTFYLMVGASIVQDVVENPETANIANRVVRLIEQKLDEQLGPEEVLPEETK